MPVLAVVLNVGSWIKRETRNHPRVPCDFHDPTAPKLFQFSIIFFVLLTRWLKNCAYRWAFFGRASVLWFFPLGTWTLGRNPCLSLMWCLEWSCAVVSFTSILSLIWQTGEQLLLHPIRHHSYPVEDESAGCSSSNPCHPPSSLTFETPSFKKKSQSVSTKLVTLKKYSSRSWSALFYFTVKDDLMNEWKGGNCSLLEFRRMPFFFFFPLSFGLGRGRFGPSSSCARRNYIIYPLFQGDPYD